MKSLLIAVAPALIAGAAPAATSAPLADGSFTKLIGEVVLVNEGGTWRVDDQLTEVDLK